VSRRRHLSEEERALWSGFARSIKPLRSAPESPPPPASKAAAVGGAAASKALRRAAPKPTRSAEESPPLAPLDRRLRRRVARGREPIDACIDLHGLTQAQAHTALLRFLRAAQADGARVALIVTGKGMQSANRDASERGVLRRQVPIWLSLAEFRPFVLGFEDAHVGHGGQGALYVRLRRSR
jgi:DNA-nicking Smr family endonuclease